MIFLIGHRASGKTETARILVEHFGFLHIETSSVIKGYKMATAPDMDVREWEQDLITRFGQDFLEEIILSHIAQRINDARLNGTQFQDIIITGHRQRVGLQFVLDHIEDLPRLPVPEPLCIAMQADEDTLYRRYKARNRDVGADSVSAEEFHAHVVEAERSRGLTDLISMAHFHLDNSQDGKDVLTQTVAELFHGRLGYQPLDETREDHATVDLEERRIPRNI